VSTGQNQTAQTTTYVPAQALAEKWEAQAAQKVRGEPGNVAHVPLPVKKDGGAKPETWMGWPRSVRGGDMGADGRHEDWMDRQTRRGRA